MTFADWARENRQDQRDTGIDLVAQLADSPVEWCAIQCKFYREGYRIQKADIDSFFTASGKRPFTRRLIVDTTDTQWSEHADAALQDQIVETTRVGLSDLEESGIDWTAFARDGQVKLLEKKRARPHQVQALAAVREGLQEADRGKLIMAWARAKHTRACKSPRRWLAKAGAFFSLCPLCRSCRRQSANGRLMPRSRCGLSPSVQTRKSAFARPKMATLPI
jgi:predicted helicase